MKEKEIKQAVQKGYADIAKRKKCCCPIKNTAETISKNIGYTTEEMQSVPSEANLGLGCGNPVALASLKKGEQVLDLGSGAGFDCFLAAQKVGATGFVIGVDMTPEMIKKAQENATQANVTNVEFRLGDIEQLPVEDNSVDVVISNCVINLAPDKQQVFQEAFRVLRPGGRLMVSDIVLLHELPASIKQSVSAYIGCLSGAILKDDYLKIIKHVGFSPVDVLEETLFPTECMENDPTAQAVIKKTGQTADEIKDLGTHVVSIKVKAHKPG